MKVAFAYPPLRRGTRYPLLGQNRQFRYTSSRAIRIYPLVPATSVTLLKESGYDAALIDGINSQMPEGEFKGQLDSFDPDVVVLETKTPLMPRLWDLVGELKKKYGTVVFVGDHASGRPGESLAKSGVDYVIQGGDYDLGLLHLVRHLMEKQSKPPEGVWYRQGGRPTSSGPPKTWTDLDEVPFIDRELTRWELYGEAYLQKPCTYILTGRGCGGFGDDPGRCSFCSWQHNLWGCTRRWRSPGNVARELGQIVENQRPREIFDDNESGMTWNPGWLEDFREEMSSRGILGNVDLSSNSRADALTKETCKLLSDMDFRLLKIGLESGNDDTLDRIGKGETADVIERGIKNAKDAGLNVLLTAMVGYPWEGPDQVERTVQLARRLLRYRARIGDSLQASIVMPYPGTPLNEIARREDMFSIDPDDYAAYDMSGPVLRAPIDPNEWCGRMWRLHLDPLFILSCLKSLRSLDQVRLAVGGVASLMGHAKDF